MTSVRKLVLVPKEEWDKMSKLMGKAGKDDFLQVEAPLPYNSGNQSGGGEQNSEKDQEEKKVGDRPPSPTPSPTVEGERGEEGGGLLATPQHVERLETGKDQTHSHAARDAGVWRPPGLPASSRKSKRWIFL